MSEIHGMTAREKEMMKRKKKMKKTMKKTKKMKTTTKMMKKEIDVGLFELSRDRAPSHGHDRGLVLWLGKKEQTFLLSSLAD